MSIRKIAEMTGLSIATVSNVLNGTRATSEESKQRVVAAASEIGYRPNMAARMLRTQRSNTIALIVPTDENNRNANYFYMDMLLGIHAKLMETGYNVIVATYSSANSGERSLSAVEVCRKQWVDGVLLVPSSKNPKQLEVLHEMDVPFVLVDRKVTGSGYSYVGSDNEEGAYRAVELLIRNGKRRIGLIGGGLTISSGNERVDGYRRALEAGGLPYDERLVSLTKRFSLEQGGLCALALLDRGADALFISDNVLAMGAVETLKRENIEIPGQVSVVSYDYYDWMRLTSPPLTTVKQQSHQMGYVAAEMLLRKLSGMDVNEHVTLGTELILGGSHGSAP